MTSPPSFENGFSFLLASDFDQTLSFNDSGYVLCELLGIRGFEQKVAGLAKSNLVHPGAELAYLLRHDPQFRGVRREHLCEVGKRVRLKDDLHISRKFCARVCQRDSASASFRRRHVKLFNLRWQESFRPRTSLAPSSPTMIGQVRFLELFMCRPVTERLLCSNNYS